MVVSGLPERNENHANEIVEMGFDMLNAISTIINPATGMLCFYFFYWKFEVFEIKEFFWFFLNIIYPIKKF